MMGGDITLTSKVGQGSVFQFEIQVQLADPAHIQVKDTSRRVVGLEPGQPTYRILVADESDTSRQLLVTLLTGLGPPPQGFEVREATDGQEAVEVWEQWEPHLIWMDIQMPVMDGYEATKRIKALPKGKDCVIAALTASAFDEDRERALSQGCDTFVGKPFRKHEIFDTMAEHLGVRFVYEDLPVRPSHPEYPLVDAPDAAELQAAAAALPQAIVADLREATVEADLDLISDLIDQIRGFDERLGDALASLARDFKHDAILTLIEHDTAPD
jgi:CheY-like chemotaxis protein